MYLASLILKIIMTHYVSFLIKNVVPLIFLSKNLNNSKSPVQTNLPLSLRILKFLYY